MTPLFHLENIVRTYPDPASRDPHAVRTVLNLSELDIRAGEILGIRGHNGSGKSTLLRIIALLEPPDSGTVLFEGRPAGTDDLHLRRQVTLLLQTPYLLSRSVASNVAYGLRVRGIRNASELQSRIAASLLAVGLDPAVFLIYDFSGELNFVNEQIELFILLSKHQLLHVLTERNGIAVFIIPPLIQFDFNDLRGIRSVIAEIFIEQLKEQHRFSASADAGNDFDLAIPHITNEPIQIIVALNHFFHLELVTRTSLLIG